MNVVETRVCGKNELSVLDEGENVDVTLEYVVPAIVISNCDGAVWRIVTGVDFESPLPSAGISTRLKSRCWKPMPEPKPMEVTGGLENGSLRDKEMS